MYSKRIENLRPFPSKNPKTALKQQERFQRACRRIFTTKTISTSTSSSSKEVKKALKPLKHLQYRVKPTLPIGQHYLYRTPVHLISPPEKEKSTPPPILLHHHQQLKTPLFLSILIIPDDLLPFVPDGPLYSRAGLELTPGSSAFVNRLRDLKYNHEKAERAKTRKFNIVRDLTLYQDIYHKEMSILVEDFNIPYSSVIDVNQPHYDTDIDAYSPGRINYKRLPELHSSLKRKTPCPEDDFASDT
ncbi:hypothetical protein GLOIN_2v1781371 [Rhizophagus irregularis DAOM 181602=DAOM 197198]|nr:hypothetical protein GLOIN_2v1781371 [Rhizophagus irregularis DAOM 181602=DAOM 197198]